MQTVSRLFFSLIAAAFVLSATMISAEACEGAGMTVWKPTSQSVADGSVSTPIPPVTPGNDG